MILKQVDFFWSDYIFHKIFFFKFHKRKWMQDCLIVLFKIINIDIINVPPEEK